MVFSSVNYVLSSLVRSCRFACLFQTQIIINDRVCVCARVNQMQCAILLQWWYTCLPHSFFFFFSIIFIILFSNLAFDCLFRIWKLEANRYKWFGMQAFTERWTKAKQKQHNNRMSLLWFLFLCNCIGNNSSGGGSIFPKNFRVLKRCGWMLWLFGRQRARVCVFVGISKCWAAIVVRVGACASQIHTAGCNMSIETMRLGMLWIANQTKPNQQKTQRKKLTPTKHTHALANKIESVMWERTL